MWGARSTSSWSDPEKGGVSCGKQENDLKLVKKKRSPESLCVNVLPVKLNQERSMKMDSNDGVDLEVQLIGNGWEIHVDCPFFCLQGQETYSLGERH